MYPVCVRVRVGVLRALDGAAEDALDGPGMQQAVLVHLESQSVRCPAPAGVTSRVCPVELLLLLLRRGVVAVHVVVLLAAWIGRVRQLHVGIRVCHRRLLLELSLRVGHRLRLRVVRAVQMRHVRRELLLARQQVLLLLLHLYLHLHVMSVRQQGELLVHVRHERHRVRVRDRDALHDEVRVLNASGVRARRRVALLRADRCGLHQCRRLRPGSGRGCVLEAHTRTGRIVCRYDCHVRVHLAGLLHRGRRVRLRKVRRMRCRVRVRIVLCRYRCRLCGRLGDGQQRLLWLGLRARVQMRLRGGRVVHVLDVEALLKSGLEARRGGHVVRRRGQRQLVPLAAAEWAAAGRVGQACREAGGGSWARRMS